MRGRAAGGKAATITPSVNIAVRASDQAFMRVASDATGVTASSEPVSQDYAERPQLACSFLEYELGHAECGGFHTLLVIDNSMLNAIGAYCKEPLPVPTSTAMLLQEQITLWFQHLAVVQQQFIEGTHQLESKLESKSTMASATTTATSGTNPSDQDILASIPGVGTIVLARLLGEAGTATTPPCGVSLESPRALIARGSLVGRTQHLRAANSRLMYSIYQCTHVGGTSRSHLSATIRSTEDVRPYS